MDTGSTTRTTVEHISNGLFVTIESPVKMQRVYCATPAEAGALVSAALLFTPTDDTPQFDAAAALQQIQAPA